MARSRGRGSGRGRGRGHAQNHPRDGGRDAFGVAEHALGRLNSTNWRGVAKEILSVEIATDEELFKLAHMMMTKGIESPQIMFAFNEMTMTVLHRSPAMWTLRSGIINSTQEELSLLLESRGPDGSPLSHPALVARLLGCMDFFGQMFVSNLFTIQLLHLCLREVLKYPSPLHIEAAAYLLHIAEPAVENHLHTFTLEPAGVLGRMRLGVYFDRIEDWCSMCHMDNEIFDWIMDEVVSPRRRWEQQQRDSAALSTCVSGDGVASSTPGADPSSPEDIAADETSSMHPDGPGPIFVKATEAPLNGPTATNGANRTEAAVVVSTRAVPIGPTTERNLHMASDVEAAPEKSLAVRTVQKTANTAEAVITRAGATVVEPMSATAKSHDDSVSPGVPREQPCSPGTPPQWSYADLLLGRPRPSATTPSGPPALSQSSAPAGTLNKETAGSDYKYSSLQARSNDPQVSAQGAVSLSVPATATTRASIALVKDTAMSDISQQSQYDISGCVAAAAAAAPNASSKGNKHTSLAPVRESADCTEQQPNADAECDHTSQERQEIGQLARIVAPETHQLSNASLTTPHSANAEPGQYTQAEQNLKTVSTQAGNAPVGLHLASAELGPHPQAERDTRSAGSKQAATSLTRNQPQTSGPRRSTHDRRESAPWAGQHANASPLRPHVYTAEPRQSAKAEHKNTLQGNAHPCQPPTTPQLNHMELRNDFMPEPDSMSHVHPRGADEGDANPNEPSTQAGQTHSLSDTLDIALQELLLTEDREDFKQSIEALLGDDDVTHFLQSVLSASWHKLHGASWSPDHHPHERPLKFASPKQRKAAANDALYRTFRKAGTIDPAVYSHKDSLQLGPAVDPRRRLPFKLHYSNTGYQMLLKQGWQEGKGLGCGATGRADPYIPTHQCGKDAHLGLGCMRYKDILTGKGAEDEIREAIIGLCTGQAALFSMAALAVATEAFLASLLRDTRDPVAKGLFWIGSVLGGLISRSALTLQQADTAVRTAAAAAKAGGGHMAAWQTECRQHVMRGAVSALAPHTSPAQLRLQLRTAGLEVELAPRPVKAAPQQQRSQPAAMKTRGGNWAQRVAAG